MATTWDKDYLKSMAGAENGEKEKSKERSKERKKKEDDSDSSQDRSKNRKQRDMGRSNKKRQVLERTFSN